MYGRGMDWEPVDATTGLPVDPTEPADPDDVLCARPVELADLDPYAAGRPGPAGPARPDPGRPGPRPGQPRHLPLVAAAVDDTHGTLLGLGQGTYRAGHTPGPRLIDLTRATYRRWSFPGCRTRAVAPTGNADHDHVVPHPHGPTTSTFGKITLTPSADPADPPGTLR